MNTHLKNIAIILIATVIGYASMGLFISAIQEWIFNGVSYYKSSLTVLAIAGLGTFLSAVAGGWIAFKINSYRRRFSNYAMCILVIFETTWLINTHRSDNPIWFEVAAATSLIVGILLGCNIDYFKNDRKSFSAFAS